MISGGNASSRIAQLLSMLKLTDRQARGKESSSKDFQGEEDEWRLGFLTTGGGCVFSVAFSSAAASDLFSALRSIPTRTRAG
ncbi:hypothetical protein Droror1_Dr00022030 [Drosera rotundifolia]